MAARRRASFAMYALISLLLTARIIVLAASIVKGLFLGCLDYRLRARILAGLS